MQIQENIALAPYTTFKLGGPARYFSIAKTTADIEEALRFSQEKHAPVFVLGGGSNVLIADQGYEGMVLKVELGDISAHREEDIYIVTAGAGASWDEVVSRAVHEGAWGIENLSGVPGTVGGAVVQNIGAYGAALSQVLQSVEVFDRTEGKVKTLSVDECRFGYRGSIFKEEEGRYIVLSATLALSLSPKPNVSYKDLQGRFDDSSIDIQAIRSAILDIRKGKFPDLSVEGTAGSFFKNPIMSQAEAALLQQKYPEMPIFHMPETDGVKVPLAWLLDNALHLKGFEINGARVFEKQALVIAAARGTSSNDVKNLAEFVEKKVFDELKIKIEAEVKII